MTRETKVGMLVSCSFLCLVGAVLYFKMTQGDRTGHAGDPAGDRFAVEVPPRRRPRLHHQNRQSIPQVSTTAHPLLRRNRRW